MDKETRGQLALAVQITRFSLVGAILLGLAHQLVGLGSLFTALVGICGLAYMAGVTLCVVKDTGKYRGLAAASLGMALLSMGAVFLINPIRLAFSPAMVYGKLMLDMGGMALFFFYLSGISKDLEAEGLPGHFRGLGITLLALPPAGFVGQMMVPTDLLMLFVLSGAVVMLMVIVSFSGAAAKLTNKLQES